MAEAPWLLVLVAVVAEDIACLVAGALVAADLALLPALGACWLGTLIGDAALWGGARLVGPTILTWPRVEKLMSPEGWRHLQGRVGLNTGRLVMSARMLPGLRLPVYLALGGAAVSARRFLPWAGLAALTWTLALGGLGLLLGEVAFPILDVFSVLAMIVFVLCVLVALRALRAPSPPSSSQGDG